MAAFPASISPWTEEAVNQFLEEMYSSLDAGSLTGIQKWLEPQAWHLVHSTDGNGTVVEHEWKGRDEIQTAVQGWFDNRGNMTEPIRYEIVKYQFPMLIVRVYVTEDGVGTFYGSALYILQGDKVASVNSIWAHGSPEETPLDRHPSVIQAIDDLQQDMSTKDPLRVAPYLSEDLIWTVLHRRGDEVYGTGGATRDELQDMVLRILAMPSLQDQLKVTLSIIAFQWPGVIVEGNVTSPADSDTVIAEILAGYMMSEVDGQITIYNMAQLVDWKNVSRHEISVGAFGDTSPGPTS
eukprot:GHVQ01034229.1.p1 GENE.GHVQ01034229.1~~GHVQ01034229.1.p1  ORF type:complete len:294 (+),score=30.13 GHVQ01034229.1:291-1172(+)